MVALLDKFQQLGGDKLQAVRVAQGLGVGAHLGQLAGLDQQLLHGFDQPLAGQVLFLDDDGVSAPERAMTKSAAANSWGILLM